MTLPTSTARVPDLTDLENKSEALRYRNYWKEGDPEWQERAEQRLQHREDPVPSVSDFTLPYQREDKFDTDILTMSNDALVRAALRDNRIHDARQDPPSAPYDPKTRTRLRLLDELNDRGINVQQYSERNSKAINDGIFGKYVHSVGPPFNGYFWWHDKDMEAAMLGVGNPRVITPAPKTSAFRIPLSKTAAKKVRK